MDLDQSEDAFLVRQPYPLNSVQVFVPETLVPRQPDIDRLLGLLSNPGFLYLDLDGVQP